ncbi:MAG: SDR family oxidoreductase [Prolixibacteraceae bacterium]|jgi:short-subunit dehydrogenase|nr:SDR family oxidoreductase [Prolixibacteraceae bacterium]MBT6766681.1 SDR family oxidoreductase [Prolixibacteraceae bacterium]MBT6997244.1 SDR family oxidoreductase [Prolixibacteraceae bacterium]MBT7396874.1 SDR family oxidoreductase [Prolixibacteraceae bacterium]
MQKKVVIITGASSGIGKALAEKYASEGWNLVLAARRIGRLKELEKQLNGVEVLSVETDVANEKDCKDLILGAIDKFGQIDVLINNAGISMRASVEEVDLNVMHKVMDVNYWGTVYCSKFALPYLVENNGTLVGVISIAGYVGLPGRTGYSASKFAVRGFLETVRVEYMKTGLRVLVAAPGFTSTEIRKSALNAKGKRQGETPRNENKMMSAEKCAGHIFKAIKKRKRTIVLTFWEGKAIVLVTKFLPKFVERIMYRVFSNEPDSPLK